MPSMTAQSIADILVKCFNNGGKTLICGNGGSAGESQHFAGELISKLYIWRKPLPAISLTTDTSVITAIGNDLGFDQIFARQVEALGKRKDVLIVLSTSGKSPNCLNAIDVALEKGMIVVDFPRKGKDTPEIQENQLKLIHKVCELVENEYVNFN
jgi:D-sedoheptulose 7-phosphate isomerase